MPDYFLLPRFFNDAATGYLVLCVCIHCGTTFWAHPWHIQACPSCGLWGGY